MNFDPQDFKILCRVIKEIELHSSSEWSKLKRRNETGKQIVIDNHETLISLFPPIPRGKLRKIAHENTKQPYFLINESFYLPPLEGDHSEFVPILNIQCDFRKPKISYRLGMIKYIQTKKKRRARGFGHRYECEYLDSSHGYPHVQITSQPLKIPFQKCPSWIPHSIPCIPLPAQDVVSLLLCVIISLYGKKRAGKMILNLKVSEKYKEPIKNILT